LKYLEISFISLIANVEPSVDLIVTRYKFFILNKKI
tara:strand:- start:751 stop:858 length:108 start_codon:yes stop_codon:yes gene_type:complete